MSKMTKKKTDLKKIVHFYETTEDMFKQFEHDVETVGKEFEKMVYEYFDLKNPWDQAVLSSIFTNLLANMVLNAKLQGVDLENKVIEEFKITLECYIALAKEKGFIV